jgi:branched-chain amino acid transport system substrate-binding protein
VRGRSYPREYYEAGREHQEFADGTALAPASRSTPSATDFAPIKQFQLRKFKTERWELFGDVISSEVGG